ncbi:MAG: transglutaminase-like domain-containing protein [Candidatus Hydrogenedentes bacterium]|nr:transglutaminase-like domain-containing protein [Candidatus Hydrogenedentota bacterium]
MKRVIVMILLTVFPRMLAAQAIDVSELTGESWYGLYLNGQKSGYSMNGLEKLENGNVAVTEDSHFRLTMGGIKQDMRVYAKRLYAPDGSLIRIDSEVEDSQGVSKFEAVVQGEEIVLTSRLSGQAMEKRLPKPKESLRDALKQVDLAKEGAKIGDRISYTLFEPMKPGEIHGTSEIVGEEERIFDGVPTKVFRVKSILDLMNMESVSYVTEKGVTLEDTTSGMLTMRLEPKEIAQDVKYSNDVIVSNAAMVTTPLDDPRGRDSLHLRLTGPLQPAHLFNDERQKLIQKDGSFEFFAKKVSLDGFQAAQLPITDESVKEWMQPSLFVQSDDPKIVAKAKEIVGAEKDAVKISQKLCAWVYKNVKSTFSARLTNAREVLDSLEGDCTEHSILYIALARAAGLPAREVAGLLYMPGSQPGFYFHQWAKVWVGKWIDVDPTWDQPLADVTHIKLAEGDLFQQAQLIPVIGQIKVEVLEETASAKP